MEDIVLLLSMVIKENLSSELVSSVSYNWVKSAIEINFKRKILYFELQQRFEGIALTHPEFVELQDICRDSDDEEELHILIVGFMLSRL